MCYSNLRSTWRPPYTKGMHSPKRPGAVAMRQSTFSDPYFSQAGVMCMLTPSFQVAARLLLCRHGASMTVGRADGLSYTWFCYHDKVCFDPVDVFVRQTAFRLRIFSSAAISFAKHPQESRHRFVPDWKTQHLATIEL